MSTTIAYPTFFRPLFFGLDFNLSGLAWARHIYKYSNNFKSTDGPRNGVRSGREEMKGEGERVL